MSYLKTNSDLFLGQAEINRLITFLDDQGFREYIKQNSKDFGLINISKDGDFTNGLIQQGTNAGTIKVNNTIAIDSNFKFLKKDLEDNISVTDDNQWYWVKISHSYSPIEKGLVNVSTNGSITKVSGTFDFSKIVRGKSNFQSVIRFPNATLNTSDYKVVSVIDANNIVIAGELQAENNLQVAVVGTFTPGKNPSASEKDIFQYDSLTLTLILETTLETPPTHTSGSDFFLARVKNNVGSLTIQDVRSRYLYKTSADFNFGFLDIEANPSIGVEAVKYDSSLSTKDKNLVYLSWGFRSTNWTIDSSTNRITLISGEGGKFKSTADFTDNDFNGWRLYTKDGSYSTIKTSSKTGGQINLYLDSIDFAKFSDVAQQLLVVPNVEEILIEAIPDLATGDQQSKELFTFPINVPLVKLPLIVFKSPSCSYVIKYQYKNNLIYSPKFDLPTDSVGYYDEDSYTDAGILEADINDRTRIPYTSHTSNGYIILTMSATSYSESLKSVITGEKFGISTRQLDNINPILVLSPNEDKREQYIDHVASSINLTTNHFIDLKDRNDLNEVIAKDGVSFYLQFNGTINLNGNTLKIVNGYVNSGNTGLEVFNLTQTLLDRAANNDLRLKLTYDEELDIWLVYEYNKEQISENSFIKRTITEAAFTNKEVVTGYNIYSIDLTKDDKFIKLDVTDGNDYLLGRINKTNVFEGEELLVHIPKSSDFNSLSGLISRQFLSGNSSIAYTPGLNIASNSNVGPQTITSVFDVNKNYFIQSDGNSAAARGYLFIMKYIEGYWQIIHTSLDVFDEVEIS